MPNITGGSFGSYDTAFIVVDNSYIGSGINGWITREHYGSVSPPLLGRVPKEDHLLQTPFHNHRLFQLSYFDLR